MQVKVTRSDKWRRLVEVEMSPAELEPHFEKAFRKYQKRASLQGFRKGKVPVQMIRKLYGDAIQAEAVEKMLPDIFHEVREKEGLRIAAPAKIDEFKFEPEKGLHFRATVDVEPEVELKKYKDFTLEKTIYEIGDEDVAAALQRLLHQHSRLENFDGGARFGDFILADLQEVDVAGLPVIGKKFVDRTFQLARQDDEADDADDFAVQLVGAKKSETRIVKVVERPNDGSASLQTVFYQVNVKSVKEKILPTLDDAFARQVGNFESLDQLRRELRRRLEMDASLRTKQDLKNQLVDAIIKTNPLDLPEAMVEYHLDLFVDNLKKQKAEDIDEQMIRQDYRANTIWNLKWRFLRDKLIALENIALEADATEAYVRKLAETRQKDPRREWNRIKNKTDELEGLQQDLLEEKLLEHLLGQQKIIEKRISRQDVQKSKLIV